jgi:large subunit ribosomal protein L18
MSEKHQLKKRRAMRVRKKVRRVAGRPRLSVVKSNLHIHAQVIDDFEGKTLASLSTSAKEMSEAGFGKRNVASAKELGVRLAKRLADVDVKRVVLDRGAHKYHGVVAELTGALREAGLEV